MRGLIFSLATAGIIGFGVVPAALAQSARPAAMAASAPAADNTPIALKDVRVQFYLEKSGNFSENIATAAKQFKNAARGEGIAEPSSGLLVTIEATGPKAGRSNDNVASNIAQVIITRKYRTGPKTEQRVFGGFRFNEQGLAYKAFMLDAATCAPLEMEVRLGRSRKRLTIDFDCTPEKEG